MIGLVLATAFTLAFDAPGAGLGRGRCLLRRRAQAAGGPAPTPVPAAAGDGHDQRLRRVGREVSRTVTGYLTGKLVISVICGTLTFVVLALTGVPFAAVIALTG
ncbi:AI-2E family transporter [Micromonospora sp. U21]|uniref:AI-2E family transporter n=1 Tax=Micromonospora sp. U21 TaxID=2824899 RepID=UPI001FFDB95A|nr:AI-2E family transporter [Micromonospora sp. U21]